MKRQNKNYYAETQTLRCNSFGACGACRSVFYKFVSGNKELEETVNLQALKSNSLVEEIGQTKQENYELFQRLNESQRKVEELKDIVEYLAQAIKGPRITPVLIEQIESPK